MKKSHNYKVTVLSRNAFAVNGSTLYAVDFCNCLARFGFDVTLVSLKQPDFSCQKITSNSSKVKWRTPGYIQIGQYLFSTNYKRWIYFIRLKISTQFTNHFRFLRFLRNCRDRIAKSFGHKDDVIIQDNKKDDHFIYTKSECSWVSKTIHDIAPQFIVFDFIDTIPLMAQLQNLKNNVRICLAHDIFHRRPSSAISGFQLAAIITKGKELAYFNKMSAVITIQDEEASYLKSCKINPAVFSIPFSIMAFRDNAVNARRPVRHQLLFIGNHSDHNEIGLKWFIRNVFPLLREKASDYQLICCGSVCGTIDKSQLVPGIYLCGIVNDLSKYYMQSSCTIVPLLFGSGLKTKLMESLANSCPVVSTSIGVQGIQKPERYGIVVADHPREFAEAIHMLEGKKELTREEKMAFELDFSPEKIYQPLLSFLKKD